MQQPFSQGSSCGQRKSFSACKVSTRPCQCCIWISNSNSPFQITWDISHSQPSISLLIIEKETQEEHIKWKQVQSAQAKCSVKEVSKTSRKRREVEGKEKIFNPGKKKKRRGPRKMTAHRQNVVYNMWRKRAEKEEKWKVKRKYSIQAKKKETGTKKMTAHNPMFFFECYHANITSTQKEKNEKKRRGRTSFLCLLTPFHTPLLSSTLRCMSQVDGRSIEFASPLCTIL